MALPVYELAKFVATNLYKEDPSTIYPLLQTVHVQPGVLGIWHGPEVQDPNHFYLVVAWESLDHYNALINDAELLATMRDLMAKVVEKRISIHHVRFPVNVETALNAPITELAVMTLKESANRDELLRRSHETLAKMYEELPGVIIPGSCAPLVDNDKKLQVCVGWQSYELFQSEVPRAQGIQPMIMELREMMELVMNHGKLTKFITN